MKVLMWLSRGTEVPGGHRIQLEHTAAALRSLGLEVDEHLGPQLPSGDWDVVHGFQLGPDDVLAARQQSTAVAISTIYVGLAYETARVGTSRPQMRGWFGRGRRGMRYLAASMRGREALTRLAMREMNAELAQITAWSMADVLLPNAEGEARHIREDLHVRTATRVVPNAIDAQLFTSAFDTAREPGTVLCVGRVEPHKNQLGTIEALRGLPGVTLTVVGPPHPHHAAYYDQCRRAAADNVVMLPGVDHEELPALYAGHRTHVLASWYETTGLVSLEAAASGCTAVTTSRGHAREYFEDDAWYCDPQDPESIRRSVLGALAAEPSTRLRNRIQERFTWETTARKTLAAYEEILSRPERRR